VTPPAVMTAPSSTTLTPSTTTAPRRGGRPARRGGLSPDVPDGARPWPPATRPCRRPRRSPLRPPAPRWRSRSGLYGPRPRRPDPARAGFSVNADHGLDALAKADTIIVPASGLTSAAPRRRSSKRSAPPAGEGPVWSRSAPAPSPSPRPAVSTAGELRPTGVTPTIYAGPFLWSWSSRTSSTSTRDRC
jgi:hypothetical protein